MKHAPFLALLLLLAATPATKPTIDERYDRFSGQTILSARPAVTSLVDGITIEAVAWVSYTKDEPAEAVRLDVTITGMKTRWSERHRPEVIYLWNGKDRVLTVGCPYGVRDDGSQTLRLSFRKESLAKTIAARTTEFKIDEAEFSLTPEAVAAMKELAKRGKVK